MRGAWAAAGIVGGLLAGACVDLLPYQCGEDGDCRSGAIQGWCEDAQYCSYPDEECESGRRFGDLAGSLANICTGLLEGSTTSPTTTSPSTTQMEGSSSLTDDSMSDTGSSGPGDPVCGDGMVDAGEECDDGNPTDGDGCNSDCVAGGSVRWSGTVDGAVGDADRYFGLTQLASGDVVTVGFIHDNVAVPGNRDVLISRWSIDGMEVARRVHDVGGSGDDDAQAVVQDGVGRVLVCGRATIAGLGEPWVSRWDANLMTDPEIDDAIPMLTGTCYDIVQLNTSNVVAVGGDNNTIWTYRFGVSDFAGGDPASIDEMVAGTDSWLKGADEAPDGDLFVAGQLDDMAVVFEPPSSMSLGTALYTSAVETQPQSMAVTDTDFILGGILRVGGDEDDLWIASFDIMTGSENWVWAPVRPAIDEVEDIALDPAGNVYAIGHVTADNDNPDRWVGMIDAGGALVWERNDYEFSEIGDDRGRSIEVLPNGDLIVVGEFTNAAGNLDGWIARLAP